MYIAFLDEFGHIGPYVARTDPRYNHSPVFGLAGYILPHHHVRRFATWFYQYKGRLLSQEIAEAQGHPATWEKKGKKLYRSKNIESYRNLRGGTNRMINKIFVFGGRLFYYGIEKYQSPEESNATNLYKTCMSHTIRRINHFCGSQEETFLMILDEHEDRIQLLEAAAKTMFGEHAAVNLLEPPFQVESHLYQTIQAADWIATIIGKLLAYRSQPAEFADYEWAERYFGSRIGEAATHSKIWKRGS